jgi:arylsulfatase A-like enzyme
VRRRVSLADAGPTLLDLAGLEVPKGSRGLSVLPGAPAPWRLHLATVRRLRPADVLYEEDLKLLRDRETGALALYDLAADPGETQDLSKRRGSELSRLKAALDERVEAP